MKVEELTGIRDNLEKQRSLLMEKVTREQEEAARWRKEAEEGKKKLEVRYFIINKFIYYKIACRIK